MSKKNPTFRPKSADDIRREKALAAGGEAASKEQLAISVAHEIEKRNKRTSIMTKVGAVWTLISTVYAIVSTCIFIAKGWLTHTASIVLVCILALYIVVFGVLAVMTFKDFKGGTKRVKVFKKTLKIFKAIANVVLLSITAVSMVGIGISGLDALAKLVAFIVTFIVAVIQLAIQVALLAMKIARTHIAKTYKVEFVRFVDGKRTKKGVTARISENKYKDK